MKNIITHKEPQQKAYLRILKLENDPIQHAYVQDNTGVKGWISENTLHRFYECGLEIVR